MSQRTERIDQLLREEIGSILERDIADPRIGFVTVTAVDTSPDLRHAHVYVSVLGGQKPEVMPVLEWDFSRLPADTPRVQEIAMHPAVTAAVMTRSTVALEAIP